MARRKTFYQGNLDSLCGIYSIVNALEICGYSRGDDADAAKDHPFRIAAKALKASDWPKVLWEGTGADQFRRMLKACVKHSRLDIEIVEPFKKTPPRSNTHYWSAIGKAFAEEGVRCAIIGLNAPEPHWIVLRNDGGSGKRRTFIDSDPHAPKVRKNSTSLHAGARAKGGKWHIETSETFILRLND
jgi:hypothetical protein